MPFTASHLTPESTFSPSGFPDPASNFLNIQKQALGICFRRACLLYTENHSLYEWFSVYNKTQAQMAFGLGKSGGAKPVPILEAWGQFPDESTLSSQLEEGVEQTNLRKLPLCRLIVKNPIDGIWLVGKDVLQGARNGR